MPFKGSLCLLLLLLLLRFESESASAASLSRLLSEAQLGEASLREEVADVTRRWEAGEAAMQSLLAAMSDAQRSNATL